MLAIALSNRNSFNYVAFYFVGVQSLVVGQMQREVSRQLELHFHHLSHDHSFRTPCYPLVFMEIYQNNVRKGAANNRKA